MELHRIAGVPGRSVPVPPAIARLARGDLVPVWENELGGLTFRDDASGDGPGGASPDGSAVRYLKWVPAGAPELDLAVEAERLVWAAEGGAVVPRVLEHGSDARGEWLVTAALPGSSAVAPRWIEAPETAALAIGSGLRRLHETLDPADCPYDWSVEYRLAEALGRSAARSDAEQLEALADPPPVDRLVVCHGDACAPNTLLDEQGGFAGHVDLGSLGVADRWADLAVAAWSTEWNYGGGYEHLVYEGYGIDPDPVRIAYYRLLWDRS